MSISTTALLPQFLCHTLEALPSHRTAATPWKSKIAISHTQTTVFYTCTDTTTLPAPDHPTVGRTDFNKANRETWVWGCRKKTLPFHHLSNSSWLHTLPLPPKPPAASLLQLLPALSHPLASSPGSISLKTTYILNTFTICFCFCTQAGGLCNRVSCSEFKICTVRYFSPSQESTPTKKVIPNLKQTFNTTQ